MRSSTIFIVFGVIIVGFVLLVSLSKRQVAQSPVMQVASEFTKALQDNDAAAAEKLLDPTTAKVLRAGPQISAIHFTTVTPFRGAFARRPEVTWNYLKLSQLTIGKDTEPVVADTAGVGTVDYTDGSKLYLKLEDGAWKVLYIARAQDETN